MADDLVPQRRLRAGDAERDEVITILQNAYAAGRLSVDELGERQDRALQATYVDEFDPLVDDLPEGHQLARRIGAPVTPRPSVPPAQLPEQTTVTIMAGKDITLQPGTRLYRNFAFWGGDTIDVSDAMGPGAVVTLELHAIMAGHDVLVPDGVRVVDESIAIMAGNDVDQSAKGDGSNGTLILKGVLFWAGNDVKSASRPQRG